jgi:hypothetical protein
MVSEEKRRREKKEEKREDKRSLDKTRVEERREDTAVQQIMMKMPCPILQQSQYLLAGNINMTKTASRSQSNDWRKYTVQWHAIIVLVPVEKEQHLYQLTYTITSIDYSERSYGTN